MESRSSRFWAFPPDSRPAPSPTVAELGEPIQEPSHAAQVLFAGLLTASVATAQTLDGDVQRNPDDTVTYTLDLDGPPRGAALLFGSIGLGAPWNIPGIGQLYLDPLSIFGIGPQLQLDASGRGRFQITVPWQSTDGLMPDPDCSGPFVGQGQR